MATDVPSPEVLKLAAADRRIAAIKLYRQETGAGLATAKSVIDGLPRATIRAGVEAQTVSASKGRSRRAATFLAATLIGFVGVAVTGTGVYRAHVAAGWTQTDGEIVHSRTVRGGSRSTDEIEVEYTFPAAGQLHRGSRISYTLIWGTGFTEALRSRYPVQKQVTVRYDPSDPTRSVLETHIPVTYWIVLTVSLVAFSWGSSRWIREARRERAT